MDTNTLQQITKAVEQSIPVTVWIQLIVALATLMTAAAAWLKASSVKSDVQQVHLSINSRLTDWLKIAAEQGHAAGKAQEKADEKDRQSKS